MLHWLHGVLQMLVGQVRTGGTLLRPPLPSLRSFTPLLPHWFPHVPPSLTVPPRQAVSCLWVCTCLHARVCDIGESMGGGGAHAGRHVFTCMCFVCVYVVCLCEFRPGYIRTTNPTCRNLSLSLSHTHTHTHTHTHKHTPLHAY